MPSLQLPRSLGRAEVRRTGQRGGQVVIASAALMLLMAGGLWWAGTHIRSVSQAQAIARPPKSALITVQVRKMVVTSSITLAGTVSQQALVPIGPPNIAGSSAVVTDVRVTAGALVSSGDLVADVSGRPIFVLQGRFPMYRGMSPGLRGPDVAELQRGLAGAGYVIADPFGVFGPSTLAAARELYGRYGYALTETVGTGGSVAAVLPSRMASVITTIPRELLSPEPSSSTRTASPSPSPTPRPTPSPTPSGPSIPTRGPVYTIEVGEIAFIPSLPSTVFSVNASVGADPSGGPIVTLSSGPATIKASLSTVSPNGLKDDLTAVVTIQGMAKSFAARVSAVSEQSGLIRLTPLRRIPSRLTGQTASVVITLSKTSKPVLAVPIGALRSTPGGATALGVVQGLNMRLVAIRTGQIGDGYVEIVDPPASIRAGVRVAIGND